MSTEVLIRPRSQREARRRLVAARSRTTKVNAAMDTPAGVAPIAAPASSSERVRLPVTDLNYPGRITPDYTRPMGPTYGKGEYLWPVTADYDEEADTTRVGLSFMPPVAAQ